MFCLYNQKKTTTTMKGTLFKPKNTRGIVFEIKGWKRASPLSTAGGQCHRCPPSMPLAAAGCHRQTSVS